MLTRYNRRKPPWRPIKEDCDTVRDKLFEFAVALVVGLVVVGIPAILIILL